MNDYTAKEALELLLTDYREKRKDFSIFSEYDKSMTLMRDNYQEKVGKINSSLKPIANSLWEIADQSFFLLQVIEWKIDYLAEALLHAIRSKNPLSLANNARALVEHIASISGIGSEINILMNSLKGQQSEKAILKAIERTENYLHRAYYGTSSKKKTSNKNKSLHINDSLKKLSKEISNINEIYDFLCEYVHPNFGSNLLVSTGKLSSGKLNPPEDYHRETLDKLRRICSYCMIYLKDESLGHLSSPLRIQSLIELCLVRGAKIQNVFSEKKATPKGDGTSKETALYFPNVRTPQEAIKLTYDFFETNGYKLTGKKEIGGIENGFIYDVHVTNKGKVWVRIPMLTS